MSELFRMGRLLQKFLHGIVPSWLTNIKASDSSSHRRRLSFFKAGTNLFSSKRKSSARPSLLAITNEPTEKEKDTQRQHDRTGNDLEGLLKSSPDHNSHSKALPDDDNEGNEKTELQNSKNERFSARNVHENETQRERDGKATDKSSSPLKWPIQPDGEENVQEISNGDHAETLNSTEEGEDCGEEGKSFTALYKQKETCKRKRDNGGHHDYNDLGHEVEDEGGGGGTWSPKRQRDMSQGLTSCELPEYVSALVGNAEAVVEFCEDPGHAFWESMVDMIVENDLWETGNLEFLLDCYLSLNDTALHDIIVKSFMQVIHDLLLAVEFKDNKMKFQQLLAMA